MSKFQNIILIRFYLFLLIVIFSGCSSKKQILYLNDLDKIDKNIINTSLINDNIEIGDILDVKIQSLVQEAAILYNNKSFDQINNIAFLKVNGYRVNKIGNINLPVLGDVSTIGLTINDLEKKISNLLSEGKHLINPSVKITRLNSKFTVLGEVRNPGTFEYLDNQINLFQALGYAGDLTIDGNRKITLIREDNGVRTVIKVNLTKSDLLDKSHYQIKNNDVIIVHPNFSKTKSAGFIGSPSSIASISSLLLSITLLIINN